MNGTGKTLTSIAIVGQLWKDRRIRKALIVAPLSILGVWEEEFQKFAAFGYEMTLLTGSLAHKAETIRSASSPSLQVLVVNYESAWRLETELLRWRPDCIIADECHKIKTHNARASKTMHKLGVAAKYRLALTCTVITNKPIDVFSQYKFADPSVFGGSFYIFRNRYFDMTGYGKYTPVMKQAMETEFTQRLHSIAFRATKAECLDLPDTTDVIQRIDLEPAALRAYRQLVKDSYTELQDGAVTVTNVLTRLLRLSQLTGGFLGSDDDPRPEKVSSAKLDALEEILESADGQKLVIRTALFSSHPPWTCETSRWKGRSSPPQSRKLTTSDGASCGCSRPSCKERWSTAIARSSVSWRKRASPRPPVNARRISSSAFCARRLSLKRWRRYGKNWPCGRRSFSSLWKP